MVFSSEDNFKDESKKIRERILDAAELVFSNKGFAASTVREITSKAECNLAAVNYHFGNKENLYLEVFRRRLMLLRDERVAEINKVMTQERNSLTLEKLLKAFADAFLLPLINKTIRQNLMKLMMYEMLEPHLPKQMFAEEVAIPTLNAFGKAIKKIYPELNDRMIFMHVVSIIGQLMHTVHLNEMFQEETSMNMQMPSLDEMMNHIVEFSAAGIRKFVKG